jgi:hypothetical protein
LVDNPNEQNSQEFMHFLETKVDEVQSRFSDEQNCCPDFRGYTLSEFDAYARPTLENIIGIRFTSNSLNTSAELRKKLMLLLFSVLRTKGEYTNYTGLIFTGFGEEEIYPSLIPVNISMVVDDRLRYYVDDNRTAEISDLNNGAVRPFAQTDVIDTILSGIDPALDEIYLNNFSSLF